MNDISSPKAILDLGCTRGKIPGSVGVDIYPFEGVDIVHDLNVLPWPIEDNSFDMINAKHIIEHVESIPDFMHEIHRVAKSGATVIIETPHFTSLDSWADPTHKWHLSYNFPDQFTRGNYLADRAGVFQVMEKKISFGSFLMTWPARLICGVFGYNVWERYFSFIFRARNISAELRVIK